MKLPAAHGTQVPCPFVLAAVPGLHGVCCVLPVGAKWPASVSVHSLALVRLVELEYVPSLHGSAALAPLEQNEPGSQATHACSPSSGWYLPAAHLSHVPLPASGWTVPGLHLNGTSCHIINNLRFHKAAFVVDFNPPTTI